MRRATLPGEIEGEGPDVVLVDLSLLGQARTVTLDGAARVTVHRSGRPAEALGASLPDDDVVVLEVDAPGRWRLTT
jgi:hypothetical protein